MNRLTHTDADGITLETGVYTFSIQEVAANRWILTAVSSVATLKKRAQDIGVENWQQYSPEALLLLWVGWILQNRRIMKEAEYNELTKGSVIV